MGGWPTMESISLTLEDLIQVGVELAEGCYEPELAAVYLDVFTIPADAIAALAKLYAEQGLGVHPERDIRSCDAEDGQRPYLVEGEEDPPEAEDLFWTVTPMAKVSA